MIPKNIEVFVDVTDVFSLIHVGTDTYGFSHDVLFDAFAAWLEGLSPEEYDAMVVLYASELVELKKQELARMREVLQEFKETYMVPRWKKLEGEPLV